MEREAKRIIRNVRLARISTAVFPCVAFVLACFFIGKYAFVVALAAVALEIFLLKIIEKKMILSIQLSETDSKLYREVVYGLKLTSHYLTADFCAGDYKRVVNICVSEFKRGADGEYASILLSILADCYFFLGDREKLRAVSEAYKSFINRETCSVKKGIRDRMSFVDNFLDEKYEDCLEFCRRRVIEDRSIEMYNEFRKGIVYYRMGEFESAKQYFGYILTNAPKMGIATLAEKGIEAIESCNDYSTLSDEVLPDDGFDSGFAEHQKRRKKINVAVWVICGVLLAAMAVYVFCTGETTEDRIEKAVEDMYGDVDVLAAFFAEDNNEKGYDTCVLRTSYGIVAGVLYSAGEEDEFDFSPLITLPEGFSDDDPFTLSYEVPTTSAVRESFVVGFALNEDILTDIDNVTVAEFEENGKTYYFFAYFTYQAAEE